MIRRIFQNIRKQDWTAVVIELVVVILGVFIGVQVSNWNADLETERKAGNDQQQHRAHMAETVLGMAATAHAHDTKMEAMREQAKNKPKADA